MADALWVRGGVADAVAGRNAVTDDVTVAARVAGDVPVSEGGGVGEGVRRLRAALHDRVGAGVGRVAALLGLGLLLCLAFCGWLFVLSVGCGIAYAWYVRGRGG